MSDLYNPFPFQFFILLYLSQLIEDKMQFETLKKMCNEYLDTLCDKIHERCVGSEGNRKATTFFQDEIRSLNWEVFSREFNAIDWINEGATLEIGKNNFPVLVSPYSLGCDVKGELVLVTSINELGEKDLKGKIVLLHGEIAKKQIMPKNFVFYNPEHHQQIINILENSGVLAIIASTSMNPEVAGGVYPFPMFEDGDFDIPSVYMKDIEGEKLLPFIGQAVTLSSKSQRIPGKGYNVIAKKRDNEKERIVISAHIDAKKGTPGAIDNATGVTVLLLLAYLLKDYAGNKQIELVAFNGEDYYAIPGQMLFLEDNKNCMNDIYLNINIDGAGYKDGNSTFSFFDVPQNVKHAAENIFREFPGIQEGVQWVQGDHSIFVQNDRPAIAVSSQWFLDNMSSQDVTHTPKDNLSIVDSNKVVEIALAIKGLLEKL